MHLCEKSIIV